MIHEIDETLKNVLRQGGLPEGAIDLAFDAPTPEWAARRTTPTVNTYLYDIREDLTHQETGPYRVRDERGVVIHRRQPYRWFRLSYLVTAWTERPRDEHRLLSSVLGALLPREAVEPDQLTDPLAALGVPVPLAIAVPPPESRSLADLWSALGGELKPSVTLVVTAPFPLSAQHPLGPPVTEIGVRSKGPNGSPRDPAERRWPRPSGVVVGQPGPVESAVATGGVVGGPAPETAR